MHDNFEYVENIKEYDVCVCLNLPSDSFSPESGGSVKPRTAIDAIRTQGTIKLKK